MKLPAPLFCFMLLAVLACPAHAQCDPTPSQRISMKQSLVFESVRQKLLEEEFTREADIIMTRVQKSVDDQKVLSVLRNSLQEIGQRCFMEALREITHAAEGYFTEDELRAILQSRKLENKPDLTEEEQAFMASYNEGVGEKAKAFSNDIRPTKDHALEVMNFEFRKAYSTLAPASPPLEEPPPPAPESAAPVNNP